MARTYKAYNGVISTSGATFVPVTTGTGLKTLMQIAVPSTGNFTIIEYGVSFDGSAAATPIIVDLVEVDAGATITQYVSTDIIKLNQPGGLASGADISSTTKSGYTATNEQVIASMRTLDVQLVAPTNQFIIQKPLGRDWVVQASKFIRLRVKAGAAVNAIAYIEWEE